MDRAEQLRKAVQKIRPFINRIELIYKDTGITVEEVIDDRFTIRLINGHLFINEDRWLEAPPGSRFAMFHRLPKFLALVEHKLGNALMGTLDLEPVFEAIDQHFAPKKPSRLRQLHKDLFASDKTVVDLGVVRELFLQRNRFAHGIVKALEAFGALTEVNNLPTGWDHSVIKPLQELKREYDHDLI